MEGEVVNGQWWLHSSDIFGSKWVRVMNAGVIYL